MESLMRALAKQAFKKGNPWNCPHCQTTVKSKDYGSAEAFAKGCLDHSVTHYGKKPEEDCLRWMRTSKGLKLKRAHKSP